MTKDEVLIKYPEAPRIDRLGYIRVIPGMRFFCHALKTEVLVKSVSISASTCTCMQYGEHTNSLYVRIEDVR